MHPISSHVLRVSKFVPRELTGSALTGPSGEGNKEEKKKRGEEKIRMRKENGWVREGDRRGDSYHLARFDVG